MLAARYIGDRTVARAEEQPVDPGSGPGRASTSPSSGSAAPTCTSCTARWMRACRCPAVIGHEMSGRIAAVGAEVTDWRAGRPRDGHAARLLRAMRRLPRRSSATSARRLVFVGIDAAGRDAAVLDGRRRAAGPPSRRRSRSTPPRSPSRSPSPCTTSAASGLQRRRARAGRRRRPDRRAHRRWSPRARGAEVLVSEPDAYRRSVARAASASRPPTRRATTARARRRGVDGRRRRPGRVRGLGRAAGLADATARARRPRPARRRRDPSRAGPGRSAPRLLARADADRRARLRAPTTSRPRSRCRRAATCPPTRSISADRAARADAGGVRALEAGGDVMKVLIDCRA